MFCNVNVINKQATRSKIGKIFTKSLEYSENLKVGCFHGLGVEKEVKKV